MKSRNQLSIRLTNISRRIFHIFLRTKIESRRAVDNNQLNKQSTIRDITSFRPSYATKMVCHYWQEMKCYGQAGANGLLGPKMFFKCSIPNISQISHAIDHRQLQYRTTLFNYYMIFLFRNK